MGFKRPFDDEELEELPFKNPGQFGYNDKLARFIDTITHSSNPQKPHISVEGGFRKDQCYEELKTDALDDVALETSAPLSLVTSTSSEEDTGAGVAAILPVSSEYADFALSDQEDLAKHDDDENDVDDDSGYSDGDNHVGDYSIGLSKEDYGINHLLKEHVTKSFDESGFDPVFQQTHMGSGIVEDFDIQQDACMSFEFQPNMVNSHSPITAKSNLHDNGMKDEIIQSLQQQSKLDESNEPLSNVYLFDTFDSRIWDTKYPTSSTKGIVLQPTSNIIEEIFGQDS